MAKAVKKTVEKPKAKRRAAETYKSYINKVLKQVHPKTRISKKGMTIVNLSLIHI